MRKLMLILLTMALVLALAPGVAYAATGGVQGQGKGGNTAPTVTAISVIESGSETEVAAMTPLTTYRVKVTASDINTIDDIQQIEFHIYFTSDGTQWDADACGIFKWTKTGSVWSMENGSAITSWALVGGSCIAPSVFTSTTGDWYLAFKPGKLAEATASANWKASATVRDENKSGSGSWTTGASMSAYAEIGFDAATITFGDAVAGIEPGQTGYIEAPTSHYLTAQVLTNKQHALGVSSEATWDDGGSNTITLSGTTGVPSGSAEFSLAIDDEKAPGNSGPKTPQAVTSTDATISGLGTVGRVTTNANTSEAAVGTKFYMALAFSLTGIQEVTYGGTITFSVTN